MLSTRRFRPRNTFCPSRLRKTERGPLDVDNWCCFDVEIGDHVSVMMMGTDVFVNAVVASVNMNALNCRCAMQDSRGQYRLQTFTYFYDEFTACWRFGWTEPRTRAQHLLQRNFNSLLLAGESSDGCECRTYFSAADSCFSAYSA
jgi:hypothetical protein